MRCSGNNHRYEHRNAKRHPKTNNGTENDVIESNERTDEIKVQSIGNKVVNVARKRRVNAGDIENAKLVDLIGDNAKGSEEKTKENAESDPLGKSGNTEKPGEGETNTALDKPNNKN